MSQSLTSCSIQLRGDWFGRLCGAGLSLLLIWLEVPNLNGQDPVSAVAGEVGFSEGERREQENYFENHVRPLFLARCLECHSQQSGKTSGGLALDSRSGWQKGGDSGPAIVPGDPDASLLLQAIKQTGQVAVMPPDGHGPALTQSAVMAIEQWIASGAFDPREGEARLGGMELAAAKNWWSFQPLFAANTEASEPAGLSSAVIDSYLNAARRQHKLVANSRADRATLLRRASLDLHGLLPSPGAMESFLHDEAPDAWSRAVDSLLHDPAYGERWGKHWLDLARYADTAGDGADYPVREAYLYRDWVVQALNEDKPIDRFIVEQVAGDILAHNNAQQGSVDPEEYAQQVTATGFLAIGKRYGYAPNRDFQHLDFADCIDSLGRSLLGLSLGCARCHDHKYDPITVADYYGLYGVLESTQWSFPGGEEHKRPAHLVPLVPASVVAEREAERATRLQALNDQLKRLREIQMESDPQYVAGGIDLAFEYQQLDMPPSGVWLSAGPNQVLTAAQSPFTAIHPAGNRGVRVGSSEIHNGIRYVRPVPLQRSQRDSLALAVDFRTIEPHDGSYRFYFGRGVIESLAIECSVSKDEFAIRGAGDWIVLENISANQWYSLRLLIDSHSGQVQGQLLTEDDSREIPPFSVNPSWDGILDTFISDGIGHRTGQVPARDIDNVGLQYAPFPPVDVVARQEEDSSIPRGDVQQIATAVVDLEKEIAQLASAPLYPVAYGVSEGSPTQAKIQIRGEPERLGDAVPREGLGLLAAGSWEDPQGSGRALLARWLVDPSNPLTARVFVNRVWQWHFGQGLVSTPSDFGSRGDLPSHPELLDYLAGQFIRSGWSLKQLHRAIMLTDAYQLSSKDNQGGLAIDPGNRFLWKFSRRALDAESLRDSIMLLSGNLDQGRPQPHPFPPVDAWAYTIHNPFHAVYENANRSIYQMLQRNRRHPYFAMFDGADPNLSVANRLTTTTPTQSLYLMNSSFIHHHSGLFAKRIQDSASDDQDRIRLMWRMALGRGPSPDELSQTIAFLNQYQKQLHSLYDQQTEDLSNASWQALCRVILTSNAFLYID